MIGSEVDRMRHLLVEAVGTLCRSGLHYKANLKVEGLIGITLDEADIILVNLNKNYALPGVQEESLKSPTRTPDPSVTPVPESEDDQTTGTTPRSKRRSVQSDCEESSRKRHRPPVTQGRTASQASCTRNTNSDQHTSNSTPPAAETRLSDPTVISPDIPSESLAAAAESWLQCSGSGSTATDSKAVVKIEIDSDPEDVIKIEEKPFTDCASQRLQPDPSVNANELTGVISTDYSHSNPGMSSEHFTNASTVPAIPMQLYSSVNPEVSSPVGLGVLSGAATYDQTQVPTASGSGTNQNIPGVIDRGWSDSGSHAIADQLSTINDNGPDGYTLLLDQHGHNFTGSEASLYKPVSGTPAQPKPLTFTKIARRPTSALRGRSFSNTKGKPRSTSFVPKHVNMQYSSGPLVVKDDLKNAPGQQKKQHQCPICKEMYSNQRGVTDHIQTVHERRSYICTDCGAKFAWRTGLIRHRHRCEKNQSKDKPTLPTSVMLPAPDPDPVE